MGSVGKHMLVYTFLLGVYHKVEYWVIGEAYVQIYYKPFWAYLHQQKKVSSITQSSVLPKYSGALSIFPRVFLLLWYANYSPCFFFFLRNYHAINIASFLSLNYQQVKFFQNFRGICCSNCFSNITLSKLIKSWIFSKKHNVSLNHICTIYLKRVLSKLHPKINTNWEGKWLNGWVKKKKSDVK